MFRFTAILIALLILTMSALAAPPSEFQEKEFSFPFPVQWRIGNFEISVAGVAWGPANSPEMISKGNQERATDKPLTLPVRPLVLAIRLRGSSLERHRYPRVITQSGLLLIKDVSGEYQAPLQLTQAGFAPFSGSPGIYDMVFNHTSTAEFWDFFPVSPGRSVFLFKAFGPQSFQGDRGDALASFRVLIKQDGLEIVNLAPTGQNACGDFTRKFSGTIRSDIADTLQLTAKGKKLSGIEQYAKIGNTLWLGGYIDPFGNFILHEEYPKGHLTGTFKGHFSHFCTLANGFFSKPVSPDLLPFEFHQDTPAGTPNAWLARVWNLDATYRDRDHGVTFQYPSIWRASTQSGYWPPALKDSFAPPIAGFGYDVGGFPREQDQKDGPYSSTNLEGFGIVYSAVEAASAAECNKKAASLAYRPEHRSAVFGGRMYAIYETGAGGMSQSVEGKLYATYADQTCYLFETDVTAAAMGALEDTGISALTTAQSRFIDAHLLNIMKTVRITPRR